MGTSARHAWYGSNLLAASIPKSGVWTGMGEEKSFADKFWWWREGFSASDEPKPDLTVSAIRLDGPHESVLITTTTSGRGVGGDWDAMLVGMHFPSAGCWEIRGNYNGNEALTLVLKVSNDGA